MRRKHYQQIRAAKDGFTLSIGIIVSDFHDDITGRMLTGALQALAAWRVKRQNTHVMHVPGSFEIPLACLRLAASRPLDAIVALGCVIKGETSHDRYIAEAVSLGIMEVSLLRNIPIAFGVLTTNTVRQSEARSRGKTNKGTEAAHAALAMALAKYPAREKRRVSRS